ncbi:beta-lactamase [Plakobranchus ocellatus]|uniref:Beta-lactamase n=1 Tax=Plakobranchus ocellatus TaxID=259542 RepID=A0AAV4BXY9_9GAST|nr:beta-lactamase [Plakobranchus ocellatus]
MKAFWIRVGDVRYREGFLYALRSQGIELYIGLPPHLFHRFARIHEASIWEGRIDPIGIFFTFLSPYFAPVSNSWDIQRKFERINSPDLLSIGLASGNAVASARGVAKMYDFVANNGSVGHQQLLSPTVVAAFAEPVTRSLPNVFHADNLIVRGLIVRNVEGHHHIGHSGLPGNYAWADITIGAGFAYLTNHLTMYLEDDPRQVSLRRAFLECFSKYQESLKGKT